MKTPEELQKDAYLQALDDVRTVLHTYNKVHFPTISQAMVVTDLFLEIEQLENICNEPKE